MPQPQWTTPSDLGSAVGLSTYTITLEALPVAPASSVTYILTAGTLPPGFSRSGAVISGTLPAVDLNTTYGWTIRARDNLGNIADRSFTLTATPQTAAYFTDSFTLESTLDSTWIQHQVAYFNPDPAQIVEITVESGTLPAGLKITSAGSIQGYAQKPTLDQTVSAFTHTVNSASTTILSTATTDFLVAGAQIVYASSSGNIVAGSYYYIREILNSTDYTISQWQNGTVFTVGTVVGLVVGSVLGAVEG